jgi:hypothetical protein
MVMMNIEKLKYKGNFFFYSLLYAYKLYRLVRYERMSDRSYLEKMFPLAQEYPLDLDNPRSLNEKIQWLKINDRRDINTLLADKYKVRNYIKENFGEEYLIPLVYVTNNPEDIKPENLPDNPIIVKCNHDSGHYQIIRDKSKIDWHKLQVDLKWWMSFNYYYLDREWQYKNMKPTIIVEKLLFDKNGKIPNDYKLHCINGRVEFVYVSVDREGKNKRNIYDRDWKPVPFVFAGKDKIKKGNIRGEEIEPPVSYQVMLTFAEKIASLYDYVRVDFYDVDGKLFFGEVTHHHGGGFDQIRPLEWDYKLGEKISLQNRF